MPVNVRDRERLGSLLQRISDTGCCHCKCEGDHCKTETGERCELITESITRRRCTGVACVFAEATFQREKQRGRLRAARGRGGRAA